MALLESVSTMIFLIHLSHASCNHFIIAFISASRAFAVPIFIANPNSHPPSSLWVTPAILVGPRLPLEDPSIFTERSLSMFEWFFLQVDVDPFLKLEAKEEVYHSGIEQFIPHLGSLVAISNYMERSFNITVTIDAEGFVPWPHLTTLQAVRKLLWPNFQ
ncbi:hypothetical protein PIB30_024494 [Stylosanthes scabra]|uniref:Uncharacterized protein n=1 Tax=Stylosanthes scabra TaxID=79078 RepID=A0ABU6ZBC9_9FABA|nr:hypothetical protein [Stylosanthes scabra]